MSSESNGGWHGVATMADLAMFRLKADIVWGRLEPASRLRPEKLQWDYAVGVSPIREALIALSTSGLVHREGQRGFYVAPVSSDEIREITSLRCDIEALALERSMKAGDDQWEAIVVAAWHRFSKFAETGGSDTPGWREEWEERHAALHVAFVSACDSPGLLKIRTALNERSDRYRHIAATIQPRPSHLGKEAHEALFHAVMSRDIAAAALCSRQHIASTVEDVLSRISKPERLNRSGAN